MTTFSTRSLLQFTCLTAKSQARASEKCSHVARYATSFRAGCLSRLTGLQGQSYGREYWAYTSNAHKAAKTKDARLLRKNEPHGSANIYEGQSHIDVLHPDKMHRILFDKMLRV